MTPLIDTSNFQLGVAPGENPAEGPDLEVMAADARAYVEAHPRSPPISEVLLAYGIGKIFAVFLVRYEHPIIGGECDGDRESWVCVGDVPMIMFETLDVETPARAMELYCCIAEDWANQVLAGDSLADSYPIAVEPTEEHARMLTSRTAFIRKKLIPRAPGYVKRKRSN